MYKATRLIMLSGLGVMMVLAAGCGSTKPLQLEASFNKIELGRSNAADVLNLLPAKGTLHTDSSVSAFNKKGWSREVGIVTFGQKNSVADRFVYVQRRSSLTSEKIYLLIRSVIPQDLLEQPYETDMRKHMAILRYCHEAMITDARPFNEDQETESIIGLGRTALTVAILQLDKRPREAYKLLSKDGFDFDHSTLNVCHAALRQDADNIYTVAVRSKATPDPFTRW